MQDTYIGRDVGHVKVFHHYFRRHRDVDLGVYSSVTILCSGRRQVRPKGALRTGVRLSGRSEVESRVEGREEPIGVSARCPTTDTCSSYPDLQQTRRKTHRRGRLK